MFDLPPLRIGDNRGARDLYQSTGRVYRSCEQPYRTRPQVGDIRVHTVILGEPMTTVPPVEEVAPGVWSVPQPMPGPLEYALVYAVQLDDGVLLIDTGWAAGESLEPLVEALGKTGMRVEDVRGVVMTHSHPDHVGRARKLREETGAWLALHDPEPELASPGDIIAAVPELSDWLADLGVPADERDDFGRIAGRLASIRVDVGPDRRLIDGEVMELGGMTLEVMHTPGHAPDHACFVDRERGIVFTGDHILSDTTPNVAIFPGTSGSPLAHYLRSLERTRRLGPLLALPGHEQRVRVDERAAALIEHHETHLAHAAGLIGARALTARETAAEMPWRTPWGELPILDRYLALCETHAHLAVLVGRGTADVAAGSPNRWRLRA